MIAAPVTIYHNPDCGTSRNTLALIRACGIEPRVIEYLKATPDRDTLRALIAAAGMSVRDLIRVKGSPFKQLGLDAAGITEDVLLAQMVAHPIMINRPLVVTTRGVKLCRPSDLVLDLLPRRPSASFLKEDGSPILVGKPVHATDAALHAALREASLPTIDLNGSTASFYSHETLDGQSAGYGGFELHGIDALLRSMVVPTGLRHRGIGGGMLALLMRRAFDQGARHAWLLTTDATPFFERAGFKQVQRSDAPQAILDTSEAKSLCPASAMLLGRAISI